MSESSTTLTTADLALCAHDLRGILTVIAGYSALLRRDDLSSSDREAAHDGIDAAIARADALVGDTLSGRVSAHRMRQRVDLHEVVTRAVADARVATGREVTLTSDNGVRSDTGESPPTHAVVGADPVALARVLENILSIAAKYAPGGPLDVTLTASGAEFVVEIADRGPGIPAPERDAVFEPFFRLERDAEKPGTGLGLVVVRGAIESAGGRVDLLERDGGGTVVRVTLPRAS